MNATVDDPSDDTPATRPDGTVSPGQTATGAGTSSGSGDLGSDANPFEQGTGDPIGAGTPETPNVDGGRPDGDPEALVDGNRVTTAGDMSGGDPAEAALQSKETVTDAREPGES